MMAGSVDLEDLVEDMVAELSVPGTTSYASATTAQWVAQLRNAFWDARIDGIIAGYEEVDGIVSPITGDTPISRDLQQVIIFYAGLHVLRNRLMDLKTEFRAKSGQQEYETKQSAQVLTALYKDMTDKRTRILRDLSAAGIVRSYYIDTVVARTYNDAFLYGSDDGMY